MRIAKGGMSPMPNPTTGFSVPSVDKKELPPHTLVEGVPQGSYQLLVGNHEVLDARAKCTKCETVTHQQDQRQGHTTH